jgi:hypothetical protein
MMPRLRAEESLLTTERLALGTGGLKKEAARDLRRRWTNEARLTRKTTRPATREMLANAGIALRTRNKK